MSSAGSILFMAPPELHLTYLSAEDKDQWHYPPHQTELQLLPRCKLVLFQPPHSSSLSLFSCSTLKMIKRQISTMAGLSCWRWRAVPPGRWTSIKLQPAMEGSFTSHTGTPAPSWGLQPLHCQVTESSSCCLLMGMGCFTAGTVQGLEKSCTSACRA